MNKSIKEISSKLSRKIKNKLLKSLNPEYKNFKKISFSQCGEDLIVQFIFHAIKIKKPSYMDIGAHHPFHISNTALFYKNGSRGINIEPDPVLFAEFPKHRKEDTNINIGIGTFDGFLDFYRMSASTLNTFSKEEAERYSKQGNLQIRSIEKIQVTTIEKVIEKFSNSSFPQFLNVDAEGVDEMIIKSIDFDSNFPIVICIETISFSTNGNGIKNQNLIDFILDNGYILYADTNINSIFVRSEIWKR